MLWALEPFNGYGYRNKNLRSPYIWASTNHQQKGKYVADGVFSYDVMDTQVGCAAVLKYLGVGKPSVTGPVAGTAATGGILFALYQYGASHPKLAVGVVTLLILTATIKIIHFFKGKTNA
jgi:hypothetical protein